MDIDYPLEFFRLQELFAGVVSATLEISLSDALLGYTSYYKRIGIEDWDFNANHPLWKRLAAEVARGVPPAEVAHKMYGEARLSTVDTATRFGCMGFDLRGTTVIMHFRNDQPSKVGPLSKTRIGERREELQKMFQHIHDHFPNAQTVEGFSWLYNYKVYCDLFPPEYTSSMEVVQETPVRLNSAWGQFMKSSGEVDSLRMTHFLRAIMFAKTLPELLNAFPFKIFKPKAPVQSFYSFYGIT